MKTKKKSKNWPFPGIKTRTWSFGPFRGGIYEGCTINWYSGKRHREVEVLVSANGRSVQVHVDGQRWEPEEVLDA